MWICHNYDFMESFFQLVIEWWSFTCTFKINTIYLTITSVPSEIGREYRTSNIMILVYLSCLPASASVFIQARWSWTLLRWDTTDEWIDLIQSNIIYTKMALSDMPITISDVCGCLKPLNFKLKLKNIFPFHK